MRLNLFNQSLARSELALWQVQFCHELFQEDDRVRKPGDAALVKGLLQILEDLVERALLAFDVLGDLPSRDRVSDQARAENYDGCCQRFLVSALQAFVVCLHNFLIEQQAMLS